MLINNAWLKIYPTSYYKIKPPGYSDHSSLILKASNNMDSNGRFLFKNYWINMEEYWDGVITAFSNHTNGSPIANLYHNRILLKSFLKQNMWSNSNYLKDRIVCLEDNQKKCLEQIQLHLIDLHLSANLKQINSSLAFLHNAWTSWIVQRAKAKWILNEEDDLGFLYVRIKTRGNINKIKEITTWKVTFPIIMMLLMPRLATSKRSLTFPG